MISREWLASNLRYDEISGLFTWILPGKKRVVGGVAGTINSHGYRQYKLDHVLYKGANLAWLYMTGSFPPSGYVVDHIDGNRSNDSWHNLRLASTHQNAQNSSRPPSKSGSRGVSWSRSNKKWQAQIKAGGVHHHLGYYDTVEEARAVYDSYQSKLHGEFSCQRTTNY